MIHNLFSVPIYLEKLNLNNKKILNHCLKQKKHLKTAFKSNIGGWQSPSLNGRHQPLEKLITEILTMGETFRKNLNFKNDFMFVKTHHALIRYFENYFTTKDFFFKSVFTAFNDY